MSLLIRNRASLRHPPTALDAGLKPPLVLISKDILCPMVPRENFKTTRFHVPCCCSVSMWYQEFFLIRLSVSSLIRCSFFDKQQLRLSLVHVHINEHLEGYRQSHLTSRCLRWCVSSKLRQQHPFHSAYVYPGLSKPNWQFFQFSRRKKCIPADLCDKVSNLTRGRSDNKVGGWRGHQQHERQQAK